MYDYLLSPLFPRLAQNRRVIVLDRLGCGFSRQPDDVTMTLPDQARVVQQLMSALTIHEPIVVGHSFGSSVALAHALAYPGAAKGYVLLAPMAFGVQALDAATPMIANRQVTSLINRFLILNGKLHNRRLVRLAFAPNQSCMPDGFAETCLQFILDPSQSQADLRNLLTVNKSLLEMAPRYPEIEQPVVILTGEKDLVSRAETQASPLTKALQKAELVVLPKTGHMVQFVRPDAVFDAIDHVERVASDQA
ncbi:MAG: putative alpha/beta hydrolase [Dehalococcoidia bacterium]|nr:putative alpha/beta hydrolase [Dehalococcoidia bacterium]